MSIHSIDGYDFERLITELMKRMGFLVEMTQLSGDGGVDIIAYSNAPIFKGKYLIQCKRWNGVIGEPTIRDIYGVVLSEHANKGIVITNSTFSTKAIEFADNKNLELIDGSILVQLLEKYNLMDQGSANIQSKTTSFIDSANFDKDKYLYLKSRIESNRSDKQHYDLLRVFYHSYILQNEIEVIKTGLLDEYIKFNEEIINRFCKKTNLLLEEKKAIQYINGILYLLKGDIFKSIEIFKDLKLFDIKNLYILPQAYIFATGKFIGEIVWSDNSGKDEYIKKCKNRSRNVIISNLYLLFSKLKFTTGMKTIENCIEEVFQKYKSNKEWNSQYSAPYMQSRPDLQPYLYDDIIKFFKDAEINKCYDFYIPSSYSLMKIKNDGSTVNGEATANGLYHSFEFSGSISIDQLIYNYWDKPVETDEVNMLELLFK